MESPRAFGRPSSLAETLTDVVGVETGERALNLPPSLESSRCVVKTMLNRWESQGSFGSELGFLQLKGVSKGVT